jgi:hypothetical protein
VSRNREKALVFIDRYVRSPSTQQEYLDTVGGKTVLERIAKWEEER